ncbi:MAG: polysaccharide pyruvyl transferase family protein [Candidatus Riflebacteria bacterium]|nr:polysaccharide pyruvyl transferase family protein [Candidatus Riflebacteria bacterium]
MKILITGFFGEGNLGDEAILEGMILAFGNSAEMIVTAGISKMPDGVSRITRTGISGWKDYLQALPKVRKVVMSGGILQDWSIEGVTFFALRIIAAAFFNKKISLWGTGLGPVRSNILRKLCRKALTKIDVAWLRDAYSKSFFEELTGRKAHYGTDWSWMIQPEKSKVLQESCGIGINLRPWQNNDYFNFVEKRLKLLNSSKEANLQDGFSGFALRREDRGIIQKLGIHDKMHEPESFSELLEICSSFREIWVMRYHGLLAALRSGVPVIPLCYDKKVENLSVEAGLNSHLDMISPRSAEPNFCKDNFLRLNKMKEAFQSYLL